MCNLYFQQLRMPVLLHFYIFSIFVWKVWFLWLVVVGTMGTREEVQFVSSAFLHFNLESFDLYVVVSVGTICDLRFLFGSFWFGLWCWWAQWATCTFSIFALLHFRHFFLESFDLVDGVGGHNGQEVQRDGVKIAASQPPLVYSQWKFFWNNNMKVQSDKKIGQGPPPPLIWTKSKRAAAFFRDAFP